MCWFVYLYWKRKIDNFLTLSCCVQYMYSVDLFGNRSSLIPFLLSISTIVSSHQNNFHWILNHYIHDIKRTFPIPTHTLRSVGIELFQQIHRSLTNLQKLSLTTWRINTPIHTWYCHIVYRYRCRSAYRNIDAGIKQRNTTDDKWQVSLIE